VRRITFTVLAAVLLAACGGGSGSGGQVGTGAPPPVAGTRIEPAGAPYVVTVPTGLHAVTYPGHDDVGPVGGDRYYTTAITPAGAEDRGPYATLFAIPVGTPTDETPLELARRVYGEMGYAARPHGPFIPFTLGGRPGFRFQSVQDGLADDPPDEYRGAVVGGWLVLEYCSNASPATTCEAIDRTLALHDAPLPPAPRGGRSIAPKGAPYRIVVPAGFSTTSAEATALVAETTGESHLTLLHGPWQNVIAIAATRADGAGIPVTGAALCAAMADGDWSSDEFRLEPADVTIGRVRAGSCTRSPLPGVTDADLMPDERERVVAMRSGRTLLTVRCRATAAARAVTDAACERVLRTIELDGAG
jgi:hypothetical protein